MKPRDLVAPALALAGLFYLSTAAFTPEARKLIGKRDRWTCQISGCDWNGGWNVQACHYSDLHQSEPDSNTDNGRMMRVDLHILEELQRGNMRGARLLHSQHTIRNYDWIAWKAGVMKTQLTPELIAEYDEKLPLEEYVKIAQSMSLEEYAMSTVAIES